MTFAGSNIHFQGSVLSGDLRLDGGSASFRNSLVTGTVAGRNARLHVQGSALPTDFADIREVEAYFRTFIQPFRNSHTTPQADFTLSPAEKIKLERVVFALVGQNADRRSENAAFYAFSFLQKRLVKVSNQNGTEHFLLDQVHERHQYRPTALDQQKIQRLQLLRERMIRLYPGFAALQESTDTIFRLESFNDSPFEDLVERVLLAVPSSQPLPALAGEVRSAIQRSDIELLYYMMTLLHLALNRLGRGEDARSLFQRIKNLYQGVEFYSGIYLVGNEGDNTNSPLRFEENRLIEQRTLLTICRLILQGGVDGTQMQNISTVLPYFIRYYAQKIALLRGLPNTSPLTQSQAVITALEEIRRYGERGVLAAMEEAVSTTRSLFQATTADEILGDNPDLDRGNGEVQFFLEHARVFALMRLIAILGEGSLFISEGTRSRMGVAFWDLMNDARDRLAHMDRNQDKMVGKVKEFIEQENLLQGLGDLLRFIQARDPINTPVLERAADLIHRRSRATDPVVPYIPLNSLQIQRTIRQCSPTISPGNNPKAKLVFEGLFLLWRIPFRVWWGNLNKSTAYIPIQGAASATSTIFPDAKVWVELGKAMSDKIAHTPDYGYQSLSRDIIQLVRSQEQDFSVVLN